MNKDEGLGRTGLPIEEEAVIATALFYPTALAELIKDGIKKEWFTNTRSIETIKAELELINEGQACDPASVMLRMNQNGCASWASHFVEQLVDLQFGLLETSMPFYVSELKRKYFMREAGDLMLKAAEAIQADDADPKEIVERFSQKILALHETQEKGREKTAYEMACESVEKWDELAKRGTGTMSGISWGIERLDQITQGIQERGLYLIAARPSVGKTMFEGFLRRQFLKAGKRVMFASLDMGCDASVERDLCAIGGEGLNRLRSGFMTPADRGKMDAVKEIIREWGDRNVITAESATVESIIARARALKRSKGLDVLSIDYAQLIGVGGGRGMDNMNAIMTKVTTELKNFSIRENVPVLLLSQLSREVEKENRAPMLSDLRDSGSLEQNAACVIFLYADTKVAPAWQRRNNLADWKALQIRPIVANVMKNQQGETGVVGLRQLPKYSTFEEANPYSFGDEVDLEDVNNGYNYSAPKWNPYVICRHPLGAYEMFSARWFDEINAAQARLGRDGYARLEMSPNGFEEGMSDLAFAKQNKVMPGDKPKFGGTVREQSDSEFLDSIDAEDEE